MGVEVEVCIGSWVEEAGRTSGGKYVGLGEVDEGRKGEFGGGRYSMRSRW